MLEFVLTRSEGNLFVGSVGECKDLGGREYWLFGWGKKRTRNLNNNIKKQRDIIFFMKSNKHHFLNENLKINSRKTCLHQHEKKKEREGKEKKGTRTKRRFIMIQRYIALLNDLCLICGDCAFQGSLVYKG